MSKAKNSSSKQGHLFRNRGRLMYQESEFLKVSRQRYSNLEQRTARGHKNSHGRFDLYPRVLPFTLASFRGWLYGKLLNDGTSNCPYCNCVIDLINSEIDHVVPLSNPNCTYGLDNLALACPECNQQKGGMTGDDFRQLRALITDPAKFSFTGTQDVLHRLQTWIKLANLQGNRMAARRPGKPRRKAA